jgi:peptidoglycan/LPS O-acetylase OafA/YrhL
MSRKWFQRIMNSNWFFLIPLAIFVVNAREDARLRWAVLETLMNVMIALCVCRSTIRTRGLAGRVLNWPPLVFVGILSYSLYLWQQLFIDRASSFWTARFPQNLILAFCAALLCHYVIEKPFLRLRDAKRTGYGAAGPQHAALSTPCPDPHSSRAFSPQQHPSISGVSESPADG